MEQFQDHRQLYGALARLLPGPRPPPAPGRRRGLALSLFRTVRGRPRSALPALALGLAVGVLVRAALLAFIETADFDVVARYLLPGYAMLLCFAVVGVASALPPQAATPEAAVISFRRRDPGFRA